MYQIIIELENVADGDVTSVAQEIWDDYAVDLDASLGEFKVSITKDGHSLDWSPTEEEG